MLLALGAARDLWRSTHPRYRGLPREALPDASWNPPEATSPVPPPRPAGSADAPADPARRIDLNHANASELDELPGVGPVLAARIIEHRTRHGRFRAVDDLRAVRGFGPKLMLRVRDRVVAGPDSSGSASGAPARERMQSAFGHSR